MTLESCFATVRKKKKSSDFSTLSTLSGAPTEKISRLSRVPKQPQSPSVFRPHKPSVRGSTSTYSEPHRASEHMGACTPPSPSAQLSPNRGFPVPQLASFGHSYSPSQTPYPSTSSRKTSCPVEEVPSRRLVDSFTLFIMDQIPLSGFCPVMMTLRSRFSTILLQIIKGAEEVALKHSGFFLQVRADVCG